MKQDPLKTSDDEAKTFSLKVGNLIHNYGAIEYLINDLLALLIKDPLISSHMVKLPVSKRIEILGSLVKRDALELERNRIVIADLFSAAKTAFRNRNKIAHNPFVVQTKPNGSRTSGIHVIRYLEDGSTEEWLDLPKLEEFRLASHSLLEAVFDLFSHYVAKKAQ